MKGKKYDGKQPMAMKEAPGLARRARGGAMTPS